MIIISYLNNNKNNRLSSCITCVNFGEVSWDLKLTFPLWGLKCLILLTFLKLLIQNRLPCCLSVFLCLLSFSFSKICFIVLLSLSACLTRSLSLSGLSVCVSLLFFFPFCLFDLLTSSQIHGLSSLFNHFMAFIHSGYFYSATSSPLLLHCTARILCWSFMLKRHRQLRVKDLPKVPM